jgi:hypothetical protein
MTMMTQPKREPVIGLLPREARDQLIAATRIRDEHKRRVAIDAAIDSVKLRYPSYFQPTPAFKE